MAAYASSKVGLIGLTKVIAAEFGPKGIRANAILPGGTDTPMSAVFANTPEIQAFVNSLACIEKNREIGRDCAVGAVSGVGRVELRHRYDLAVDGGVSINRT